MGLNKGSQNILAAAVAAFCMTSTGWAATTWQGTTNSWPTSTNWTNNVPSTGPQSATYDADQPGTTVFSIDLPSVTARNTLAMTFGASPGTVGFTFSTAANPGFQIRAVDITTTQTNPTILNEDDAVQTFNVPVKIFTNGGGGGGSQIWDGGAGGFTFSGNQGSHANATVDINGNGLLTITGSGNTTIGITGAAKGNIVGVSGRVTKLGTGTLTLGGTLANTYSGVTTVNEGELALSKPAGTNAILGNLVVGNVGGTDRLRLVNSDQIANTTSLTLNGGTFDTDGEDETLGTLDAAATSAIDFGAGADSILHFADSSGIDWTGGLLNILNWSGSSTGGGPEGLFFGTSAAGLTSDQLELIRFVDGGAPSGFYDATILPTGEVVAVVPEPGSIGLTLLGGAALALRRRRGA